MNTLSLAPWLPWFYSGAPPEITRMMYVLAGVPLLTSWRGMGFLQLQRNLQFWGLHPHMHLQYGDVSFQSMLSAA